MCSKKLLFYNTCLIALFIIALPEDAHTARAKEKLPTSNFKTFDLSAFNATVEQVQSALKDAGLYKGIVDGRFNHDTERAILEYQNREGLVLNPIASKELVKHIQSRRKVRSLLNQLQTQRLNAMEEAREALLSQLEIRNLIFSSANNDAHEPKKNTAQCFINPTTKCLLDGASVSASNIFKNELRDWVLSEILVTQANAGLNAEASKTIRQIIDPRIILVALRDISKARALAGKSSEALNAASLIPDSKKRLEALVAIASIQAKQKDMDGAVTTSLLLLNELDQIDSPLKQVSLASEAVIVLSKSGEIARANEELAKIKIIINSNITLEQRRPALRHIANILAKTGKPKKALALIMNEPDVAEHTSILVSTAKVLAKAGYIQQAIQTAKKIKAIRYRSVVLSQIAIVQAEYGDAPGGGETLELAFEAAKKTTPPFAQAFAYEQICLALLEIRKLGGPDNFDLAVQTAGLIRDKKLHAHPLWSLATERLTTGDHRSAAKIKKMADEATKQIKSLYTRVWLLSEIALEHFIAKRKVLAWNFYKRALAIARDLDGALGRSRALVRLASVLNKIQHIPNN